MGLASVLKLQKRSGSAPIFAEKELGGDARAWLDKAYFFPIMRDEMNKNSLLIQNRGY